MFDETRGYRTTPPWDRSAFLLAPACASTLQAVPFGLFFVLARLYAALSAVVAPSFRAEAPICEDVASQQTKPHQSRVLHLVEHNTEIAASMVDA